MIFNPEFREAIRAAHRPSQRRKAQRRAPDHDDGRDNATGGDGGPLEDPDDVIDPDDLTKTKPSGCVLLLPPPAQNEAWWAALVFGDDNAIASSQDALLDLAHVAYRLGQQKPLDAITEFSQHGTMTVSELHTIIKEAYGNAGWRAFTACWQEAAGIQQPKRKSAGLRSDVSNRIPDQPKDCRAPSSEALLPLPPMACPLEEGLHQALPSMPMRAAAFLLHSPKPEPPWRYQESESERLIREDAESRFPRLSIPDALCAVSSRLRGIHANWSDAGQLQDKLVNAQRKPNLQ